MIQELRFKNFLSFKNEVSLSFEATKDTFAEEYQVVKLNENVRLLRFAVIYGYNASGKTNLLKVFQFLSDFWFERKDDLDEETGIKPFKLNQYSESEHSFFDLIFFVNDIKYAYKLELDKDTIFLEKLSYYKSTQPIMLFERTFEKGQSVINFGSVLKLNTSVKERIMLICLKNMSFFAARNQVNVSIPLIDDAKDWMKTKLMNVIKPNSQLTAYAQTLLTENSDMTEYVVNFLRAADFNITNIKTEELEKPISENLRNVLLHLDNVPNEMKTQLRNGMSTKSIKTFIEHTVENENGLERYLMDSKNDEESRGTMRTLGIEAVLYEALKSDAFLEIDEVETSLHPKLLEKILFEYLRTKSQSQLLITTHNDGLLDLVDDLIRKDSICFTEKDKSGVTDLYKLTDFRGVNRLSSIREAYRNKRFGATMKNDYGK